MIKNRLEALLLQVKSYRMPTIEIPDFYRPCVSALSYDEGGYREFLFALACWWFETLEVNLAQFLRLDAATACLPPRALLAKSFLFME